MGKLTIEKVVKRFFVPKFVVSAYYFLKFGAKVSLSAEVELTSNIRMGKDCNVSSFSKIKAMDGLLEIGNRSGFATGCFVSTAKGGIKIGDNFMCGPNVCISSSNYRYYEKVGHLQDSEVDSKGVIIGNNVWIGANSVILDGSVIGDNTVVVANSLVNRKYKPNVMLQGSPAKVILKR